jgi:hypothetical protein
MWTTRIGVRTLEYKYHLASCIVRVSSNNRFNRSRSVLNGRFSIQTSFLDEGQEISNMDNIYLGFVVLYSG